MKRINYELKKYQQRKEETSTKANKANSERAYLIGEFKEGVNSARERSGYKPLPASAIAVKLAHIPTPDLYFFLKRCQESSSFSQAFFGLLKPPTGGKTSSQTFDSGGADKTQGGK